MTRDRIKELRRVKGSDLLANPKNFREHGDHQTAVVKSLLDRIGYAAACIAREDRNGKLILLDGHLRSSITPDDMVPVLVLDVTKREADELLLSFDPVAELATIDFESLAALLGDVRKGAKDEPQIAFIDSLLAEHTPPVEVVEDDVPEPPKKPTTKPGDLWALGRHRLLCGDSTKAEDVGRLMGGKKADCLITDPPYGVSYVGKTKDKLTVSNDNLDEDALAEFIDAAFSHAYESCRPGAYWYATVPARPLHTIFAEDWKRRGVLRQIMVWVKDSMVLGHSEYHYRHEPILFGWKPGERHKNSDRTRTTVWEVDRPKASREHPTMKPVELLATAISDGSRGGEIVFDPFLGSGTTLIAAEQLDRVCYGLEISPQYCDVVVERWQNLTGKKAKRVKG